MVCDGQTDIATAQQAFATDRIAAYQKYYDGRNRRRKAAIPDPPSHAPALHGLQAGQ